MNETKILKWIAIGIFVGYLTPYLFAYLKSKQGTQAQNRQEKAPAQNQEQANHG